MKNLSPKVWAIIGMAVSLVSFILVIVALILSFTEPPTDGIGNPFALWVFSFIVAAISLFFYMLDAGRCLERLLFKQGTGFDVLLMVMILGSIPMIIFVGGSYPLPWNLYYLLLFVLEGISVMKLWKNPIVKEEKE